MDREQALADGFAARIKSEVARQIPTPIEVHPSNVDMVPVADALKEIAAAMMKQGDALTKQGELLGRLIQALSSIPIPVINVPQASVAPVFHVPELKVMHAPEIPAKPREKRTYVIVHADGEKSTVMEE